MISIPSKCSVCGGTMYRVKVLPSKMAGVIRYRCACGHCQDAKERAESTAVSVSTRQE